MTLRYPEVLVAPAVTFIAVLALLGIARHYDRLPARAPDCGFRTWTGIPCLACGGTRAFQSFSRGQIVKAAMFNPAAVLGVVASLVWFISAIFRFHRGIPPTAEGQPKVSAKTTAIVLFIILGLNWVYLILYLP